MKALGRHSARLRELRACIRQRPSGLVIVDGLRIIQDLVHWGIPIGELFLSADLADQAGEQSWFRHAEQVWIVAPTVMEDLAPTRHPQGVLAIVHEPPAAQWAARRGAAGYLDHVQDPGNAGAIIRSAAGLGAAAVLLSPGCADPFAPLSVRGAAGAVFRIPIERNVSAKDAIARVHESGGSAWATGTGGTSLASWRPRLPILLLFGSEGPGLAAELLERADGTVSIPLERGIDSLNVAVAAGIVLQTLRLRTWAGEPILEDRE
jgi:TrmH family RNA methyltransferase